MKTHPVIPALIAALMSGAMMFHSAAQITVGGDGANTTDSTSYSGAQSLTKIGSNKVTMTGNNTYTGGTTINAGALAIGASNRLPDVGQVTVNSDSVFDLGSFGDYVGSLTMNGNATVAGNSSLGQLILTTGLPTNSTVKTLTANGVGNIVTAGIGISSSHGGVGGNSNLRFDVVGASDSLTLTGVINDKAFDGGGTATSGAISKAGQGTLLLLGNNTYTGGATISAGTVQVGNGGTTGNITGNSAAIVNNGTLIINRADGFGLGNAISGSGTLVQAGSGTTTISAVNTYTGGTLVDAGTLVIGAGGTLLNTGSALTVNNGATVTFARQDALGFHTANITMPIVLNDGGLLQNSGAVFNALGALNLNGGTLQANAVEGNSGQSFALKGTVTVNGSATSTISGAGIALGAGSVTGTTFVVNDGAAAADLLVTGVLRDGAGVNWPTSQASSLTKNGLGTMVLSGNNAYSGETTINSGVLQVGNGGTTGSLGTGTINNKGVLAFNRSDSVSLGNNWATFSGIGGVFTLRNEGAGLVTISDSAKNIGAINGDGVTFVLDGTGRGQIDQSVASGGADMAVRKTGTGSWTLANVANNYSGSTTIAAGTLEVTGRLGAGNYARAIANDGELHINTVSEQVLSGDISGTGQLRKSSAGTLTLSGSNTYTGATTLEAGELNVNGSISNSAVTVQSGAYLTGSGSVGTTVVQGGGTHSPGNSPGVQTVVGNLSYESAATVLWELVANSTAGRGTNYDGIDVTGNLAFNGPTTLSISFNTTGSAVNWSDVFWTTDKIGADGWLVFNVDGGTVTGFENLSLSGLLLDSLGNTLASQRSGAGFGLSQVNNDVYLTYTAVPEPSTYALLALAAMALSVHLLRRRQQRH